MKITNFILGIAFILSFLLFGINSNKVTGQVTSSSSSGSVGVVLSPEFTGNWKSKVRRASSSSSGTIGICPAIDCVPPPEGCTYVNPEVEDGCAKNCGELSCSSSSSSSGMTITLEAFTKNHGSEHHGDPKENKGSKTISLKLCVDNGQLKGTIHQGGVLDKASIISQEIISENSVSVDLQDRKGVTTKATLEIAGNNLTITFENGNIADGRRLNRLGCVGPRPNSSSSSGGNGPKGNSGMSGMGSRPDDENPTSSPSPSPSSSPESEDNHGSMGGKPSNDGPEHS